MFIRPSTVQDACEALGRAPAAILSGGTDFYPALGDRAPPGTVLDLSRIAELDGIDVAPDHVRIGARTTWRRVASATGLPGCFDALRAAAREVGSIQIQTVATVGGNLCNASPAADGVPPLLALDAEVELASLSGRRRLVLSDFLLGNRRTARRPDEVLTAILIPLTAPGARSCFVKLGARRYLVISVAMVAAVIGTEDGVVRHARVAVGACSAVAQRLPALEAALIGADATRRLNDRVEPGHLSPLSPIDDIRAPARYRDHAALEAVRRALDGCQDIAS